MMHLSELDQRINDMFEGYMMQAQQDFPNNDHSDLVSIAREWTHEDLYSMVARLAEGRIAAHQEAVNLLHYT